ncbi:hypothetical protein AAVH_24543 [Aphelenchoides avenae]|nr:hypothetical protein AAVH_24543 [Aphelenchus avenae]
MLIVGLYYAESHIKNHTVAAMREYDPPALRQWFIEALSASAAYRDFFDDREVTISGSVFLNASFDALLNIFEDEDVVRILLTERDFLRQVRA